MAILTSKEFKGDTALEACATQDPAHIMPGASGPHVRKIQDALNRLDNSGIAGAEYQGMKYGTATTTAVTNFKTKRKILNYAGRVDSIVGIKTIRALDQELHALSSRPENAVDPTAYTDVVVRFVGGSMRDAPGEATLGVITPDWYAARKRTLLGVCRGADKNRHNLVQSAFDEIMAVRAKASIGLLCIRGSSRGGIWALELAEKLSAQNVPISFVSLQDAAFSTTDAINSPSSRLQGFIDNVPLFPRRNIKSDIKISHFQRIGNKAEYSIRQGRLIWASDMDGEIHGEVIGFQSRLWKVTDYHKEDSGLAHNYCCSQAESEDLRTIKGLFEKL